MKTKSYIRALASGVLAVCLALSLCACRQDNDVVPSEGLNPEDMPTVADVIGFSDEAATEVFRGIPRNTIRLMWGEADMVNNGLDIYVYNDSGVTLSYDQSDNVDTVTIGVVEQLTDDLSTPEVYERYDHEPNVAPAASQSVSPGDVDWILNQGGQESDPVPDPTPDVTENLGAEPSHEGFEQEGGTVTSGNFTTPVQGVEVTD